MQPSCEIAVIVVLGSVKAKDYQRLRLKHFLKGRKVRIVRFENDHMDHFENSFEQVLPNEYEEYLSGDDDNEEDPYEALFAFVKGQLPGEVHEVVAYESWWNTSESFDHLFSHHWAKHWPNLDHVTIVFDDGHHHFV